MWRFQCSDTRLYQKYKSVLHRKFKALQKGVTKMGEKYDITMISGWERLDADGKIEIPGAILHEMFEGESWVGTKFEVQYDSTTQVIKLFRC